MLCLSTTYSCRQDIPKEEMDLLGYWQIVEAKRNNKLTLTLEDAYININSDSTLITNLLRRDMQSSYILEGQKLIQNEPMLIEYDIVDQKNDSLRLNTTIREYKFEFVLVRIDSLSYGD